MASSNLSKMSNEDKIEFAVELKRLIEFLSQSAPNTKTVSIDTINSKLAEGLRFQNLEQVRNVLATHYVAKTTNALLGLLIQSPTQVVWDCSVCNLDRANLENLFFHNSKQNTVLSATFNELISLSQKSITKDSDDNTINSVLNAKFLIKSILEDMDSNYCKTINLESNPKGYVDNILLKYCLETNSELYTCDFALALRAKLRDIAVTAFHNVSSPVQHYTPNPNGRNVFLDKSILTSSISLKNLIDLTEKEGGNKFVVSNDFVEALEKTKQDNLSKDYIRFFLLDTENSYSIFKNITENYSLKNVFEDTNAIAFVSDNRRVLEYRSIYVGYHILNTEDDSLLYSEPLVSGSSFNLVSSNSNFDNTLIKKKDTKKKIKHDFPYAKNYSINTFKLGFNELVWVLDKNGNEIKFNTKLDIKPEYTIVHGMNTMKDGMFKLTIYNVSAASVIQFMEEYTFTASSFNSSVSREYKYFAEILVLMKKSA